MTRAFVHRLQAGPEILESAANFNLTASARIQDFPCNLIHQQSVEVLS